MNPELRRNLWLELSTHRLIAMPVVLAAVFILTYAFKSGSLALGDAAASSAVADVALVAYGLIVVLWGGRLAAGAVVGLPGVFAVSVGKVTVEGVFREAMSNRIDAVAVSRSEGSHVFKNKPWSTWADVRASFDNWAEGIRKAVDKAHGK